MRLSASRDVWPQRCQALAHRLSVCVLCRVLPGAGSSHCGSVLTLYTPLGKIEIDGEDMTFDTDVGDVFAVCTLLAVVMPSRHHALP